MDNLFQKIINNNFSDFKGLTVDASIPVPQSMVNVIIEAALRKKKDIDDCQVSIHGENRISVNLKMSLWPWPLNLKLRLFRSVDLTSSPKIRAFLENNVLLGKLGSLFNALPDGINIRGDLVVVDVETFLSTPEQKRILDLVKSVEIRTEAGKAIFDVRLEVDA